MIQNRRNILFIFMVIAVMLTGYNLNSYLDKSAYSIELATANNSEAGDIQSDSDAHEDENSYHTSQIICIAENLSTPFPTEQPSVIIHHSYSVWQPPKNC